MNHLDEFKCWRFFPLMMLVHVGVECTVCMTVCACALQDYMQNVHGKEIDLLRTTVKVPGKRPPRAVATVAPTASPKTNGLSKDRSTLQLGTAGMDNGVYGHGHSG